MPGAGAARACRLPSGKGLGDRVVGADSWGVRAFPRRPPRPRHPPSPQGLTQME